MKMGDLRKLMEKMSEVRGMEDQGSLTAYLEEQGIELNHFYHELEMSSPFVDTHQDLSYSNAQINLHSHDFYELLFCQRCDGVEYLVEADRYQLRRGDIILLPPGVSHRPILEEQSQKPYERYVIWMSREFMNLYGQFFGVSDGDRQKDVRMLRTAGTKWERIGERFREGIQLAERRDYGWEAALVGNTVLLLTQVKQMVHDHSVGNMRAEKRELLDRLTTYVENHYSSSINLGDLSRRFYVSESTVSHLFKQKMGVSFYRYVTQRRLIAAKTLIREARSLEDVSRQVGFSDYSTFYRAFRQEYGISPRQYRERQ